MPEDFLELFPDLSPAAAVTLGLVLVILALAIILIPILMFITAAPTNRVRNTIYFLLTFTFVFAGSVAFGYLVLLQPAINFLLNFSAEIIDPQIRVGNYVTFVARLLISIGLVFETPVVIILLARLGIIDSKLKRHRIAIILPLVIAAIITPTFDPINQSLVALPLIVVFEIGFWLAKIVEKRSQTLVSS